MKKKIVLLTILASFATFSQQKSFNITWGNSKTVATESYRVSIPSFNAENFCFDPSQGIQFVAQWDIQQMVDETSTQLENVSYAPISRAELASLDLRLIPNAIKFELNNSIARDKKTAFLTLSPIVKENGNYKKVTSFTVSYRNSSIVNRNFNRRTITNSALSSGSWYRFQVDKTGVYKLSRSFLEQLGINVDGVDPRSIKLYGNGGRMIPYENSEPYPFDIEENAIRIIGETDGYFHDHDYILFYAEGPRGYDASRNTNINCYADNTYYYINISPGNGKRIQPFIQPSGSIDMVIDTFQDYQFHELDEYNLVSVGRRWFGDRFGIETDKSFEFNFPNLVTVEPVRFKVYVASTSEIPTTMQVGVNGNSVVNLTIPATNDSALASEATYDEDISLSGENVMVSLSYNNNGNPSAQAYIDYISLEATRALSYSGSQFTFYNNDVTTVSGIGEYQVANASQVNEIWDVTDIYNVGNYVNANSEATISFTSPLGSLKKYAIVGGNYYQPIMVSNPSVSNQNLKGTIFNNSQGIFEDIDYLIVTPNSLYSQAERLAQINRTRNGLNVKVVRLSQIYKEFSTGNQDIGAIRNLVKYVYDNASSPERRLKYLCLFGDGSYDYKNRLSYNTNIVPPWHAYDSFNLTGSFVSDDFYGMMDENEGGMQTFNKLDIAVGRILAETPQRAKQMVDKIESYYIEASYGNWRNNFVVVSDDVDEAWEEDLQLTTDRIANVVTEEKSFINAIKIHSDAFLQESSAGGDRYPSVNTAMVNAIENGALVVNYFGHGGEDGLAKERIFEKIDAQELNNVCKLNLFVTVTCEYTRFDNPLRPTAGEFTYWNKDGGAIGLITTTRQIFVNIGRNFNEALSEYLFSFSDNDNYEDHEYPSIAEALRLTKIDELVSSAGQKRLVFFIGDPAMKLAFGKPNVRLTKINDVPIGQSNEVLQALSRAKLSGEVTDVQGNVINDYNGILSAIVFDKNIERQTLANDGTRDGNRVIRMDFETLGAAIFRGQATIANGQFEFEFIVPRDIEIPEGNGRVSFYAKRNDALEDQSGANITDIVIGGLNTNAPEDNIGPVINLYMNDESFVSGGITNESPSLLVKLEDENGINTANGIGHDIVAIIDGDETNQYVLNDYYQADTDNYQAGSATYPLRDLEPGLHTLTLKAWDVYNNSSTSEIQFVVHDENQSLVINNVLNYPNPFVNYTEFWFNHNSSEPLDVSVQIFTVSGKLVRTLNGQTNTTECCGNGTSALSRDIVWDGRDDFGDKIGKGVYIYKLTVRSPFLNKTVEKIEKLVIL